MAQRNALFRNRSQCCLPREGSRVEAWIVAFVAGCSGSLLRRRLDPFQKVLCSRLGFAVRVRTLRSSSAPLLPSTMLENLTTARLSFLQTRRLQSPLRKPTGSGPLRFVSIAQCFDHFSDLSFLFFRLSRLSLLRRAGTLGLLETTQRVAISPFVPPALSVSLLKLYADSSFVPSVGIPGSINSSWAISGPSDEVAEPKKTSIGAFHFLVFCVASVFKFALPFPRVSSTDPGFFSSACVVEPVIRQVHHSFIVLPRAQKQILRLLQNPSEVRSLTPAWFFIPKAKKIYLAETIQATFKAQGTVGMSLTPFALSSLSFLQMAVVSASFRPSSCSVD